MGYSTSNTSPILKLFLSHLDELSTIALFTAGFLIRPLGAFLFGWMGDRIGRKYTFLVTLTGIIWVTGALKEVSLLTTKGQTILVFLAVTGFGIPFILAAIAPIALFGSVLYSLNRLNGDSEAGHFSAE